MTLPYTSHYTSRKREIFRDRPRSTSETCSDVSRQPPTRSGAAWSPTSPTSAESSSPHWPTSREASVHQRAHHWKGEARREGSALAEHFPVSYSIICRQNGTIHNSIRVAYNPFDHLM